MYYLTLFIIFFLDRLTKWLVAKSFSLNQSVPVIKNFFHLTYIRNAGALWGLWPGKKWLFVAAGLIILAAVTFYEANLPKNHWRKFYQMALGLIAGGTLGNLFDRLFLNGVVDFFDFRLLPIFNLADTFTNLGVFLIIVLFFLEGQKK